MPSSPATEATFTMLPATLIKHHPAQFAAEQEGSGQVHVQHPPEAGGRGVFGGRDEADPGVVDQGVHPAPALHDRLGVGLHHRLVTQVAHQRKRVGPGGQGRGLQVQQRQGVAALGAQFGAAAANALGRSGDDGHALGNLG